MTSFNDQDDDLLGFLEIVDLECPKSGTDELLSCMDVDAAPPEFKDAFNQQSPLSSSSLVGTLPQVNQDQDQHSLAVFIPCEQIKEAENLKKKRAPRKPVPDKLKDENYWQKRQKNNESARKCRAAKRNKMDDQILQQIDNDQIDILKVRLTSLRQKEDNLMKEYFNAHAEAEKVEKDLELRFAKLKNYKEKDYH